MRSNEIYTMYKLGGFWSTIGKTVTDIGAGALKGVKTIGQVMGDHPMATAALALGTAGLGAAAAYEAVAGDQKSKAIEALKYLETQTQDPGVQSRLEDIISGLNSGSIPLATVVQILKEGGLM